MGENNDQLNAMVKKARSAIVMTLGQSLFKAERHVQNRHMDKKERALKKRVRRIIRERGQPPERMTSTFVNSDFTDIAIAVLNTVLSNSDVLDDIAYQCVFGNSNGTYVVVAEMPDNVSGYGIVIRDSKFVKLECHYIKAVFRFTHQFRQELRRNVDNVPINCEVCTVVTIYPVANR